MSKRTPGPWKRNLYPIQMGKSYRLSVCDKDTTGVVAEVHGKTAAEVIANARLIEAAEDLLSVCEAVWRAFVTASSGAAFAGKFETTHAPALRAAIAKAEGGN